MAPGLGSLPDDVLVQVLGQLSFPRDFESLGLVCRGWRETFLSPARDGLWKTMCEGVGGGWKPPSRPRKPYRAIYCDKLALDARWAMIFHEEALRVCNRDVLGKPRGLGRLRSVLRVLRGRCGARFDVGYRSVVSVEGNSFANLAARAGDLRCLAELVEGWGASLETADHRGFTPLCHSVFLGESKMLKYILSKLPSGPSFNASAPSTSRGGHGPFTEAEWAYRSRHPHGKKMARLILQRMPVAGGAGAGEEEGEGGAAEMWARGLNTRCGLCGEDSCAF